MPKIQFVLYSKFAKALSYIFHPAFIPTYLIVALKLFSPLPLFYLFFNLKLFLIMTSLVFIYTALAPILMVYLLFRLRFVSDLQVLNREERPRVLILTSGFYLALAYFLYSKGDMLVPTSVLVFSMAANIFGLFVASFFSKISAHLAAMGGMIGIFVAIYFRYGDQSLVPVILLSIILAGFIASARLYIGAHNLKQTLVGALWGFLTGFVGVYFFMNR